MKALNYLLALTAILFITSCVPARKFEDVKAEKERLEMENRRCIEKSTDLADQNQALLKQMEEYSEAVNKLQRDTAEFAVKYRNIQQMNKELNELYEKVIAQNKDLLQNTSREKEKLALELNEKEKELHEKELDLKQKEATLAKLRTDLEQREERVQELESIISRQDSAVNALREKVAQALLGFKDDELSVEMKNGRVYVSLSENLLFKSGSTVVDPKGKTALAKLAEVLKKNPDIEVLIEGHTDDVPITSSARLQDNWDLSVLRATSIVRILTSNGVSQKRIVASGRGEYFPVASNKTPEGRALNRRTEIILSPNLDELFKILQK